MTAELVRGQNHPLPHTRLDIRVSAGEPVVAAVTLSDEDGRVPGTEWVAHPAQPALPGVEVSRQAAAGHLLAVDLNAVPPSVHGVAVLLALPTGPGCPVRFGAVAAPFLSVGAPGGPGTASYTITGLESEAAVVALEFYRRQGAWKVRAVGQGYAAGLAACLADLGLDRAGELAAAVHEAVAPSLSRTAGTPPVRTAEVRRGAAAAANAAAPGPCADHGPDASGSGSGSGSGTGSGTAPRSAEPEPPPQAPARTFGGPVDYTHPRRNSAAPQPPPAAPPAAPGRPPAPVAGDATGWSMEERLYNQVWGMFEDLARTTAGYRSAVDFAASRLGRELDRALSDPRSRLAGTGDAAREAARAGHDELTGRAREALDRDLDQLAAESEVVEPALPPAFARWDSPVWQRYRVPTETPTALRLGDLHLAERPGLRIPMLVRLPLERGLWVDSGRGPSESTAVPEAVPARALAMDTAVAHATRLLAVHPAGEFTVRVIDPAGTAARSLGPLVRSGVLGEPPAAGAAGVSAMLEKLTRRVDLVQMAVRGGAADALPPDLDTAQQLLIVSDFPHGFDDRAVTRLRYLADEGPAVGVHLLMVADREDASAYGPVLDPLWRSLLRIPPVPDDHLADPWVQHVWTYEPPVFAEYGAVLEPVLAKVAEARRTGRS
ncbi:export associated protein [Streptomyces spongiicola]|uniref:Export associated protein n=1 Tax=Streptomyces spongiicola TaxID=1690221 RepID=A0A388SXA7_9ACTN|nr:TerD family protein [Streptomyces spongiicola]GBQ01267.1 export associated protein [Streptomyces spongiicola]